MTTETIATAKGLLKKYYGYDDFRPMQIDIIESVLSGKDTLVLMPTGGGKSICFQLPSLMLKGITIVVSPLISLMKDQVDALTSNGVPAAFLNSTISSQQETDIKTMAQRGVLKLLYVSPEKLVQEVNNFFTTLDISLLAIDEAHCISQWGHDFRPEYKQLASFRRKYPETPIIALTATAEKATRKDIVEQLSLQNPATFIASFDRPNLSLTVRHAIPKKDKIKEIAALIDRKKGESGIIYCLSRDSTQEICETLQRMGYNVGFYHGQLSVAQREKVQNDFINDRTPIICATIAFGMGIDKSNVRWIVHYNLPKSMEGYYQEIGRAGRDGLASDTVLYYTYGDLLILTKFAEESGQAALNLEKLKRIQQFAEADICRRRILLSYFGETVEQGCGNCDVCKQPRVHFDGTVLIQKALSGLKRTQEKIGMNMLIDILRGSQKQEILENGYHKLKTYGAGADTSFYEWQNLLLQMLNMGIVEMAYDENFVLKVTALGEEILFGKKRQELVRIMPKTAIEKPKKEPAAPKKARVTGIAKEKTPATLSKESNTEELSFEEIMDQELRILRKKMAEVEGVPPYIVFSDATLKDIIAVMPQNLEELATVSGMAERRIASYGSQIVNLVKKHIRKEKNAQHSGEKTQDISIKLYLSGMTVEEIAKERALGYETICTHLAMAFKTGLLTDYSPFLSKFDLEKIRKAFIALQEPAALKILFDYLEGEFGYGILRIALAIT